MVAESICEELLTILKNDNLSGKTHSVFKNALNIISNDNHFITFITIDKPMAPQAIRLFGIKSFLNYGIKKGMKISFRNGYIWVGGLNIKLATDKAFLWSPNPIFSYTKNQEEDILVKLSIMENYLHYSKSFCLPLLNALSRECKGFEAFSGKAYQDKSFDFINDRFLRFIDAFMKEEDSVTDLSKKIIGYGIGLTPSMDDFICGMMVSKIYLSHYFNHKVDKAIKTNSLIIKDIDGITTRVSEEMLKLSSKGYVNQDIRSLIISLISKTSIDEFEGNLIKVGEHGFSSGDDIISGIYTYSSLLFNQYGGGRSWRL